MLRRLSAICSSLETRLSLESALTPSATAAPELGCDRIGGHVGVLDDVVEQRASDREIGVAVVLDGEGRDHLHGDGADVGDVRQLRAGDLPCVVGPR